MLDNRREQRRIVNFRGLTYRGSKQERGTKILWGYARLLKQRWTDALRATHPDERIYTFWHYMRRRSEHDAGLRLDHVLLSPTIASRLKHAEVDRKVRGYEGASDHAPVWIELAR